jgi:hypothetical protein
MLLLNPQDESLISAQFPCRSRGKHAQIQVPSMIPFRANSTHVLPNTISVSSSYISQTFILPVEYETSTRSRRVKVVQMSVRKISADSDFRAGMMAGSVGGAEV